MQLEKVQVKHALFAASCALLGGQAQAEVNAEPWKFDTAIMYYAETDRVSALEAVVAAKKTYDDESILSGKVVIDSLTGASASGAVPQDSPQTYSRPSGNGQYTTAAGETPLDDTFRDTRLQASGQWTKPVTEEYLFSTGGQFSREYDYQSLSFNSSIARYLNQKNTTVSAGISYSLDSISPVGGTPDAFAAMIVDQGQFADEAAFRTAFDATRVSEDEDKNTLDLIFGVTQVMNRRWIMQFNLSLSEVDGYMTDPYKVLSQVNTAGAITGTVYEKRPDTRSKQAIFVQSKYHFEKSIWDMSYRLSNDDWDIQSHTLETRYRYPLSATSYLEPHVRYYQQSAAEFYTPFLLDGAAFPDYASADYRIGDMSTYTLGLKYAWQPREGEEYAVRLEYYHQISKNPGIDATGQLNDLELYPTLDAIVAQFNYSF